MFRADDWPPPIEPPGVQHLPLGDYSNAPVILLDWIDYQWAIRWRWSWCTSKIGRNRRHKVYARRNTNISVAGFKQPQQWIWLHKEICFRAHGPAPSLFHTIADHINGLTLDCQRANLRWQTPSGNRINISEELTD